MNGQCPKKIGKRKGLTRAEYLQRQYGDAGSGKDKEEMKHA
jgi:hypothetical protein